MAEEKQEQSGGSFSRRVGDFVTAEPLVSHEAFAAYLDGLEALLNAAALVVHQDAQIASTWMRNRKPKKGRRVPWLERTRLAGRTRGHGRHKGDAFLHAARFVRRMRTVHEEYMKKEREAAERQPETGEEDSE